MRNFVLFIVLVSGCAAHAGNAKSEPSNPSINILVHAENKGDLLGREGEWIGTKGPGLRMEGVLIDINPDIEGVAIEYRVRSTDLEGSVDLPWVTEGIFTGSRGQARKLEGFAARLTGEHANDYVLQYQCHVADKGDSAVITAPEMCLSVDPVRRLEAIKIWIKKK